MKNFDRLCRVLLRNRLFKHEFPASLKRNFAFPTKVSRLILLKTANCIQYEDHTKQIKHGLVTENYFVVEQVQCVHNTGL